MEQRLRNSDGSVSANTPVGQYGPRSQPDGHSNELVSRSSFPPSATPSPSATDGSVKPPPSAGCAAARSSGAFLVVASGAVGPRPRTAAPAVAPPPACHRNVAEKARTNTRARARSLVGAVQARCSSALKATAATGVGGGSRSRRVSAISYGVFFTVVSRDGVGRASRGVNSGAGRRVGVRACVRAPQLRVATRGGK
uniref:Uncharacterized protein n=1 Tax=Oryza meridionalis TaxID=40149 RepID=A0A0E0ET51_9ORYZ